MNKLIQAEKPETTSGKPCFTGFLNFSKNEFVLPEVEIRFEEPARKDTEILWPYLTFRVTPFACCVVL